MGRGTNSVAGGSTRSKHSITVPDFTGLDEVFGKPKEVDQSAASADELRIRYQWGGGLVRPNIEAMVVAGRLEQVWKRPAGGQRLTKAWRVPRKGKKA